MPPNRRDVMFVFAASRRVRAAHPVLNETNRGEVTGDVLGWLGKTV